MDSFDIGISGINAAQKAFEIIGNNVANAATEGYHRQRLNLTPSYPAMVGSLPLGGGVDIVGITRIIDDLLEKEILSQQSSLEEVSQELGALRTIENAFGELSGGGHLSEAIGEFFNALHDLSAHPGEAIWQNQAVTATESMASQFRTLSDFLDKLDTQITLESQNTVEKINTLVSAIADLNNGIKRLEITGGQTNNLRDKRDLYIVELSKLISVETESREYGIVDISVTGIPVVISTTAFQLEVGLKDNLELGLGISGENKYDVNIKGGRLGGLFTLQKELIADIITSLDNLANALIQQVNQFHVQGVGSEGSFTELTGWKMANENLKDFDASVSDGSIYIRVTNNTTHTVTRTVVAVDTSTDSLSSLAADITAITGLTASVTDSKLHIQADSNYEFDFLPCFLSAPTSTDFTGTTTPPTVSVSGIYTGTVNQTFTFTVSGTGSVGDGALHMVVTDSNGGMVTTLNVGSDYAVGDKLDAGNGIKIALTTGDMVNGNTFEVDAFTDTDTSGVLAAIGMNTFLSGNGASDMVVCSEIVTTPGRLATALGADKTDNANILLMVGLRDSALNNLDSLTPEEYYHKVVADVGLGVSIRQIHKTNVEAIIQNLTERQNDMSGVDINDEAAQMLVFEQMYKAMAKYMATIQESLSMLMDIV